MTVPVPHRRDKGVALFPLEFLVADPAHTAAAKRVIDHRVSVTVRAAFFSGAKHLNLARHGRQGGAATDWIRIAQQDSVEWIAGHLGHRLQLFFSVCPSITIGGPEM